MTAPEGYLTTEEAAELLGVSPRTLYYYRRDHAEQGFPEPRRFARSLMWSRDELTKWRKDHPPRRRRVHDVASPSS